MEHLVNNRTLYHAANALNADTCDIALPTPPGRHRDATLVYPGCFRAPTGQPTASITLLPIDAMIPPPDIVREAAMAREAIKTVHRLAQDAVQRAPTNHQAAPGP